MTKETIESLIRKFFTPIIEKTLVGIIAASTYTAIQAAPPSYTQDNKSKTEYNSFNESTTKKQTRDNIIETDNLGFGILGMYVVPTDTIYVLRSLPPYIKNFVIAHERAHRRRTYSGESQDEELVDKEAQSIVGYNPLPGRNYR